MTTDRRSRTIPELFEQSVGRFGDNVLLRQKTGGPYIGSTYREIYREVRRCAAGLLSLGIQKGDRIALLSEGRNEWVIAELGILFAGAVNVPLSVKIEELAELQFRLFHSGCRIAVVSGTQARKVIQVRDSLPDLKLLVLLDDSGSPREQTMSFETLLSRGDEFLSARRGELEQRRQSIRESDIANICYTSGTTADPKGIVLTHGNYTANTEQAYRVLDFPPSFTNLLILPWDHSFAHLVMYLLMRRGASFASVQRGKTPAETLRNIPANIREIRPSFMLSVPSLAKNFRKNIEKGVRDKGKRANALFQGALQTAYDFNRDGYTRGQGASLPTSMKCRLYDLLLFRRIRTSFGGRMEYFIGGGALLDVELQKFFYAIGIPMYQGYGLTEAAPVISANVPGCHKLGTSGRVLPGLEIRICDPEGRDLPVGNQGEIVVRGENVMSGYWKNEKATREVLRDGWLFTGDIGYIDKDGFLSVLGRLKSMMIGHDGEKYSPEGIEETIVAHSPYIDQIMIQNDQAQYTIALVVPNKAALGEWLASRQLTLATVEGQDASLAVLEREINAYRGGGAHAGLFPERWLPSAIAVIEEGFTEQNRLLNSTLKVVRGRVAERFKDRIAFLYRPEGKNIFNNLNRAALASV
jgi:long-chain acyl-CoA synthetase